MTTNTNAALTDEQIDAAFDRMPEGAQGFLKSWGYRQFAREIAALAATPAAPTALSRACDLLSTTIGVLMGQREKIGYTDNSPIASVVKEAVEFLRPWPETLPAAAPVALPEPAAYRLRNTAFRSEVYEYFRTKYLAECRQKQFNASVDDGGLHDLTPIFTEQQVRSLLAQATAAPAAVAGPSYADLPDVEDMAHSAVQEVLSFGVSHDVFHRWMRAVMEKTIAASAAAQGDALEWERRHAIRQGHEIAASDSYFDARPQIDSNDRRKVFTAGFERGWDAARAAKGE